MRKIFLIALTFLSFKSFAQINNDLTLNITGYKSLNGNILLAVYNSEQTYLNMGKASYLGMVKPVGPLGGKTVYVFKNIPDGVYAISIFHDENGDGKLNTWFLEIPKERNGFSNNVRGKFGPAKYSDAKFNHNGKQEISIRLK